MEHTKEELEIINNYKNSTDFDIYDYVKNVYDGKEITDPITVGFLTENAAKDIELLTGKKVYGNRIVLDSNTVIHIRNRHGENGIHDNSMKDIKDIARISYVLTNYDSMEFHNEFAQGYVDSKGKLAPKIIISKRINGTFYIIEAVCDTKKRRNYIVSAYIKPRHNESDSSVPNNA